jgi:deazaflavin-dependent oxidoreductase (nitroreductase family)
MIEGIEHRMSTPTERRPPRWLKLANRLNIAMLSRGIGPSTQRVLTIAGRTTGLPRRTPIAIVELDGARYIVAGYPSADWVKNARAGSRATLSRGGASTTVRLVEVPAAERPPILREFLRAIRGGRSFLTVGAGSTDADVVIAAEEHPVFRLEGRD